MADGIRAGRKKKQAGYTLLEYSAGAAVLMGVLYVGLNAMGAGVQGLLTGVGEWAQQRTADLAKGQPAAPAK